MNTDPVFVVDDDTDDQEFVREIWEERGFSNPLLFFESCEEALSELKNNGTKPFLILCDVNVPVMGGFKLKEKLLEEEGLNTKSIPFVFWSTQASNEQIKKAYNLSAHGFFIKGNTIDELTESLSDIMNYWLRSKHPKK